jgi:beta-galactosidase
MNRRDFIVSGSATLATFLARRGSVPLVQAEQENVSSKHPPGRLPLLFGTDYYPDQTPENLWEQDPRPWQQRASRMCALRSSPGR